MTKSPRMVRRDWRDLTDEQQQRILSRTLPGWHPSNLPKTEAEARRTRWLVLAEKPTSLLMGSEIGAMTTSGALRLY